MHKLLNFVFEETYKSTILNFEETFKSTISNFEETYKSTISNFEEMHECDISYNHAGERFICFLNEKHTTS